MGFLNKLNDIALIGKSVISNFGPFIGAIIPGDKDDKAIAKVDGVIDRLRNVVISVDLFGAALKIPGAQKAEAVAPAILQILLSDPFMNGKKIQNPELARAGAAQIGKGIADFLNSLDPDSIKTENKA